MWVRANTPVVRQNIQKESVPLSDESGKKCEMVTMASTYAQMPKGVGVGLVWWSDWHCFALIAQLLECCLILSGCSD